MIRTDILISHGGLVKTFEKGDYIFREGDLPRYYYQIIEGAIIMLNTNYDGKEFIQAEFRDGCSFGEPPLFIDELYPSTARASHESVIIKLPKENFLKILDEYTEIQKKIIELLARRIYNKTTTTREIINNTPQMRIMAFLKSYKKQVNKENEKITIPYTRQDIANFTGLRVETVIRTLSKLKTNKTVDIVDRKLIY